MADNDEFKYDPEAEQNTKKYRLPFALCKANGIEIQDWRTPKDAWKALQGEGIISDVDEEYANFYKKLKRQKAKQYQARAKRKREQLKADEHNPIKDYEHQEGKIAGKQKGQPMTHQEADSGSVNPEFSNYSLIGYRHNCQTCVAVYYARTLGYDVKALPNLNNKNIYSLSLNTNLAYIDENGNHPEYKEKPSGVHTNSWLNSEMQDGDIFTVEFGYVGTSSGHIIIARKENGQVKYYDPQSNKEMQDLKMYGAISGIKCLKLTGCTLDEEFCDKIMR